MVKRVRGDRGYRDRGQGQDRNKKGTRQGQDRDKTGTRLGRGRAKEGKKGVGGLAGGEVREW